MVRCVGIAYEKNKNTKQLQNKNRAKRPGKIENDQADFLRFVQSARTNYTWPKGQPQNNRPDRPTLNDRKENDSRSHKTIKIIIAKTAFTIV